MPKKLVIKRGEIFEDWVVLKEVEERITQGGHKCRVFLCKCSCGKKEEVLMTSLRSRSSTNCGHQRKETLKAIQKEKSDKSGRHHSKFTTWSKMLERCNDTSHIRYDRYGGRGIKVCKKWSLPDYEGFWNFANWIEKWCEENNLILKDLDNLQLDREDNDGNYEPKNCRWVTRKVNMRNKENTRVVTYKGKNMSASEAVEKYGLKELNASTFRSRLNKGWSVGKALKTPIEHKFASR